jgi:hypothetical protein
MTKLSEEELARMEPSPRMKSVSVPVEVQRALLAEIREHRAAVLTPEEVEALAHMARAGMSWAPSSEQGLIGPACAALDKLLGNGGGR